jgi:hypothetical protein
MIFRNITYSQTESINIIFNRHKNKEVAQMKSIYKVLTINLVVASMTAFAPVQPASAQLLELATGALSILNSVTGNSNSQPAPQPVPPVIIPQQSPAPPLTPNIKAGAGNFNGNTLNLCVSGCLPNGNGTQAIPPSTIAQPAPQVIPPGVNPSFPTSTIAQPTPQVIPPNTTVQPVTPVPSQPVPSQPAPLW